MAKIISIKGQYAEYVSKLKFDDFEKELTLLHINTDFITSIYETLITKSTKEYDTIQKDYFYKEIHKEIRCISRKGELNNVYTYETIEHLIEIINF
jgi:hypothetical protein